MTSYTPESLAADWEFKIIRSVCKQFGKPVVTKLEVLDVTPKERE